MAHQKEDKHGPQRGSRARRAAAPEKTRSPSSKAAPQLLAPGPAPTRHHPTGYVARIANAYLSPKVVPATTPTATGRRPFTAAWPPPAPGRRRLRATVRRA